MPIWALLVETAAPSVSADKAVRGEWCGGWYGGWCGACPGAGGVRDEQTRKTRGGIPGKRAKKIAAIGEIDVVVFVPARPEAAAASPGIDSG